MHKAQSLALSKPRSKLVFMISVATEGELEGLGNIGLSYHTAVLRVIKISSAIT